MKQKGVWMGMAMAVWSLAVFGVGIAGANPIIAGITLDIHQDINNPAMWPNDFHIEGLICSNLGIAPTLSAHRDGPFTNFSYTITPAGLSDPCYYYFTANWSLPPGGGYISYCSVIHLALVFEVEASNIVIDLHGWWTRDGVPVGQIIGGLVNNGFWPITGFRVNDLEPSPPGQTLRIGNGDVIDPPTPQPIPIELVELEVVALPPGGLENQLGPNWLDELRVGGAQETLPWVPVLRGDGENVSPGKPLYMVPDSFFDVFLEVAQPGQPRPVTPITIPFGGVLLARQQISFINNNGQPEEQWVWHIHEATNDPQACCLDDGTCIDLPPSQCLTMQGVPQGLGTVCNQGIECLVLQQPEACCLPDGTCQNVLPDYCRAVLLGEPKGAGSVCLGDLNGNGTDEVCEELTDYSREFSLDIGSDKELSDPQMDGDEGFDPGDIYVWQGPPVVPPMVPGGRDGETDDVTIFGVDPNPNPPDLMIPPATRVPVGTGNPQQYPYYFDLDGHDKLDFSLRTLIPPQVPLPIPIGKFYSRCVHEATYLAVSYDDDQALGWPANDVPVMVPSPAGVSSYGTTMGKDEVWGVTVGTTMAFMPPYPLTGLNPYADEITVHQDLGPNPDAGKQEDDDVDALDIVPVLEDPAQPCCPYLVFTADHEAINGLDPGDVYERVPGGIPVRVIDDVIHLGLSDAVDLDAIELVWLEYDQGPQGNQIALALLFSVDDDDPLTPNVNESGGLNPNMIYYSLMTGWSAPLLQQPLPDDVDAIMAWKEELIIHCTPPVITSASSVMKHGAAGDFGIAINMAPPPYSIEPRVENIIAEHRLVFVFDKAINIGGASVTLSSGSIAGYALASTNVPNDTLVATLASAPTNNACWVINVSGVTDASGLCPMAPVTFRVRVIKGDVNASGSVNILDQNSVKGQLAKPVTAANFMNDVDASGSINILDQNAVKANLGKTATCP